jgi:prepilin-type N-terminal cleavage/methylation domain-containing protein
MPKQSAGFTLIEVLVSVMIISIVIAALLQLFSNNAHGFASVHEKILQTNKTSLLLGSKIYGYEKKSIDLAELVKDFNIDDTLRRKLKRQKVKVFYRELLKVDFDAAATSIAEAGRDEDPNDEAVVNESSEATNALEVGKTTLTIGDLSSGFLRVKIQ